MYSSIVIDHLESYSRADLAIGVACLYADYRDQSNQNLVNILGSILHQFLTCSAQPHIPQELIQILDDIQTQRKKLDQNDALTMMSLILQQFKTSFICIDALDELTPQTRRELLVFLKNNIKTSTKIFLTGRPHIRLDIICYLGDPKSEVDIAANPDDIRQYLRHRIEQDLTQEAMNVELEAEILNVIVEKSRGMCVHPNPSQFTNQSACRS